MAEPRERTNIAEPRVECQSKTFYSNVVLQTLYDKSGAEVEKNEQPTCGIEHDTFYEALECAELQGKLIAVFAKKYYGPKTEWGKEGFYLKITSRVCKVTIAITEETLEEIKVL